MTIDLIRLHRLSIPLVRPFRTSFGTESVRDVILVEAVSADGVHGWGECVTMSWPGYSYEYGNGAVDVDHVLIQADLTMIAPGPVAADVARSLRLVADVESRGHATVYRIGEESIRRALDAGWDAAAVLAFLEQTSRTPVPQPLTYLIDDVARRHGVVRVGPALAYVRCDNSETLSALLADRRLATLGLSRIADALLVSLSLIHISEPTRPY